MDPAAHIKLTRLHYGTKCIQPPFPETISTQSIQIMSNWMVVHGWNQKARGTGSNIGNHQTNLKTVSLGTIHTKRLYMLCRHQLWHMLQYPIPHDWISHPLSKSGSSKPLPTYTVHYLFDVCFISSHAQRIKCNWAPTCPLNHMSGNQHLSIGWKSLEFGEQNCLCW